MPPSRVWGQYAESIVFSPLPGVHFTRSSLRLPLYYCVKHHLRQESETA